MADPGSTSDLARRAAERLRRPPHSVEAEQSLLGGLMLDERAWDQVADAVSSEDLYRADHRIIFEAVATLVERDQPPDAVTVSEYLDRTGQLDAAGGLDYLARLVEETPSAANVRAYAQIVRDNSLLRQLIQVGGDIAASAHSHEGRTVSELVDLAEQRVFDISDRGQRAGKGFVPIKKVLSTTIDRLDVLSHSEGDVTGVSTGFTELDNMTAGLQRGELIIVAGRPSMGKTTLAVNIAENAALGSNTPVAIFSMEMSSEQLTFRMIGSIGRVNQANLRRGKLTSEDWTRIDSTVSMLSNAPIFIDDSPGLTPTEVRARARRLKREHGLGLIVIDYLQLMQVAGTTENRATEISEISRSLKALAKELDVPVIALSQLNRSVEQRTDKKPVMSDLRECVSGGTLVCLADGRRLPIDTLVGAAPEVWSVDGDQRIVRARAEKIWHVGRKPVRRVELASGRAIRATAAHRLMTGRGWVSVQDISPGDRVAVSRHLPEPRQTDESPDHQRAMGQTRGTAYGGPALFRCAPGGTMVAEHAALLSIPERAAWADSDLLWDRVMAVVAEQEEDVYDLTVPGPANWLADGIVTHNSGAIEQDADVIMFIFREEVYDPETTRRGIADVIIGKQRNGPVGDVHLTFRGEFTRFENLVAEAYGEGVY